MVWSKQTSQVIMWQRKASITFCIACITIDSVTRMEKKNYPQVYLEELKYRMKKTKMTKLIKVELESESELDSGLKSDNELELKSELKSDTE